MTNGAQWVAGLPEYAFNELGFTQLVTIGEDYSYPHTTIGAFHVLYSRLGGRFAQTLLGSRWQQRLFQRY